MGTIAEWEEFCAAAKRRQLPQRGTEGRPPPVMVATKGKVVIRDTRGHLLHQNL